ncbi:hypothetical protein [Haloplanus aerogenes]|uniref:Uncharacterized protein n=1 Tax=Haloplanus aerogenes TaxID=660522 RepID=A0A3M0CQC1_9EURY|nr:hypothetical protein [Haloplanus aerogenes]AZH26839.1 hypothetical protein DU502_16305 [Haloplanus aerogenes]RMB09069.1 hypothetical protein ATH50_3439 [Haloplanus aerogenes]
MPDWIFCPRERILEVVISWFVSGLEFLIDEVVYAVQTVQGEVIGAFVIAGEQTWDAGRVVALVVLDLQRFLNSVLLDLAGGTGFAGPIAAAVTFALVVAAVFGALQFGTWLLKWVT